MIASLRGVVAGRTANAVVIEVAGVGYLVQASALTLEAFGAVGQPAFLLVHTQVREDAITLFGFVETEERELFLMLTGVQGVGPRVALAILSVMSPQRVLDAVASEDTRALCAADGVGPKLGTRLVSELKTKAIQAGGKDSSHGDVIIKGSVGNQATDDARKVLANLGFQRIEMEQMLATALAGPQHPTDTASIVRDCLRLAQRSSL